MNNSVVAKRSSSALDSSSSCEDKNLDKDLVLLLKHDEEKHSEAPPVPSTPSGGAAVNGRSLFFFLILIGQSIGSQLFFKLSQRGGQYEYNTMSAMFLAEGFKLAISIGQLMVACRGNVKVCVTSFKGVAKRVYAAYIFLALSYASYNQLAFYIMKIADPGTFSLFKSLMPGVVAILNFFAFGKKMTQAQLFCIMIQTCGIVPVTTTTNSDGKVDLTYGVHGIVVLTSAIVFAGFNTVYNASVVKKESANYPIAVQNIILYSFGCFFNLLFYFATKKSGDHSFFYGYHNPNVIVLIFLQSTVGVTISLVYKYGDAVLKTLTQPVVSSVLLFLSNILFGTPLDIIKISGAGSVIFSTMLYLQLPPPPEESTTVPRCSTSTIFKSGLALLMCYSLFKMMSNTADDVIQYDGQSDND